jgi:acyl carrier protein
LSSKRDIGREDSIIATLVDFVKEIANIEIENPTADLHDEVGLSSIQVLELVERIEDAYEIVFPLNDLADIRTISDLASHLEKIAKN